MRISVAMACYQGERFLREQLASIAAQTHLPDELVASDDASNDGTLAILDAFARRSPFPVRVIRNSLNQGTAANFAKAVAACSGDLIALADQDDIWLPWKLASMAQCFVAERKASFAFGDALLIDEEGRPLSGSLWRAIRLSRSDRRQLRNGDALPVLLRRCAVTGTTMVFRAEYRALLLPVPQGWVHDAWFALLLACVGTCISLSEPQVLYRQHAAQQIGARRRGWLELWGRMRTRSRRDFECWAAAFETALERLETMPPSPANSVSLVRLREKLAHCRTRIQIRGLQWSRPPRVAWEFLSGRYHGLSRGFYSMIDDLLP